MLRPVVVLDVIEISGSGKVALQGMRMLKARGSVPLVANFVGAERPSEFNAAVEAAGLPLVPLVQRSRADFSCIDALHARAAAHGVDFVESHSFKAHLVAWRLARRLGVPWIAFAHGWTAENARVRLYNVVERQLLRTADHVCVVSEPLAASFRAAGRRGPITVVDNAAEPTEPVAAAERTAARDRFGFAPDALVAACVGRLSHEKGVDLLLEALAHAGADAAGLEIAIAGTGPDRAALEARAAALGLAGRVRFLGYVAPSRPVMAAADLLAIPSRSEGLPNVALEALDAGLPIVSTRVGALGKLVGPDNGWLVPPGDVPALALALGEAVAARDRLAGMGRRGRETVLPRFDANARIERLEAVYASVRRRAAA